MLTSYLCNWAMQQVKFFRGSVTPNCLKIVVIVVVNYQIEKLNQSEQIIRDLRARLSAAEKKLGDIEAIRSRSASSSESSFRVTNAKPLFLSFIF